MSSMDNEPLVDKIIELLNNAGVEGASVGDLIEIMCNLNMNVCVALGDKLDLDAAEVLSDIYSITLELIRKHKDAKTES